MCGLINTDVLIIVLQLFLNFSINWALIDLFSAVVRWCFPAPPFRRADGSRVQPTACSCSFHADTWIRHQWRWRWSEAPGSDAHSAAAALHSAEKSLAFIHFSCNNYLVQWEKWKKEKKKNAASGLKRFFFSTLWTLTSYWMTATAGWSMVVWDWFPFCCSALGHGESMCFAKHWHWEYNMNWSLFIDQD